MRKTISLRFKLVLAVLIISALLFENPAIGVVIGPRYLSFGEDVWLKKNDPNDFALDRKLLLFVIDFNDFMCLFCLDSFLNFYHSLPLYFQEEFSWGVLVFNKEESQRDPKISFRIIEKKLRGFIKANQIKFPILIDRFHIFNDLAKEGTAVFVFNQRKKSIKKYTFPLNSKQIDEIFKFIIGDVPKGAAPASQSNLRLFSGLISFP